MKHTLFIVTICFFASCITSKYNSNSYPSPFAFKDIDSLSYKKNELYIKANEWVARTFVSAKDVIQMQDKDAGKIIAKGVMTSALNMGILIGQGNFYINYTLSIDVKDDKYKIVISDFILTEQITTSTSGSKTVNFNDDLNSNDVPHDVFPKAWGNIKGDCSRQSLALIQSLNDFIKSKSDNF